MTLLIGFLILTYMGTNTVQAAQIYRYDAPIVTIRAGSAWTINGNFKLVHIINLNEYADVANNITTLVHNQLHPGQSKEIIQYHLAQIQERIHELVGRKTKIRRSIDWIGSAWKWVAGNPDATDWNMILKSQNEIINNNNEQYKVNTQLLNTTNEVVRKTNELLNKMNEINNGNEAERISQGTVNQVLVLKDAINEVVRACQLAKSGIINTNLLDKAEVEEIITEMETLPYANAVEAIEYGTPSIYTNGSLLLYVISIPKLKYGFYHRLITRATIRNGRQIELPYNEILISQNETFGVKTPCLNINELTVCRESSLQQLNEDTCISRLIKGGNANCQYRIAKAQIIEMITTDTVFLSNYEGEIKTLPHTMKVNGTYLVQLFNETILIGNQTFSSTSVLNLQPLPPVLTSMASEKLLVDIDQVHNISIHNIENLEYLGTKLNLSLGGHISIVVIIGIFVGVLWCKITRRLDLPTVTNPQASSSQPTSLICGTQTFKEGGVNNVVATANQI